MLFSALDSFLLATLESSLETFFFLVTHFPVTIATSGLVNTMVTEIAIFVHSKHLNSPLYSGFTP
jgi:hypothetical protein